jgi:transposase
MTPAADSRRGEDMEQLVSASPPPSSFGALLRSRRHRAYLSQEQLAARAEVSERTVRNLEADRVRSPRTDTVRLLADALQLSEPERESWFEAARGVNRQRATTAVPAAGSLALAPGDPPAQSPLTVWGLSAVNNHLRRRSSTRMYRVVDLCLRADGPAGPAAKDADALEMPAQACADQAGREAGTRSDGLTSADRRELVELRRENRRLREDLEVLKRAAAIFVTATR